MIPLLFALLAGCSKQEPCDSSEFICDTAAFRDRKLQREHDENPAPDPTDGTWIELVRTPGCLGEEEVFQVRVRVRGETDGAATVDIWETEDRGGNGFNEHHPFVHTPIEGGEELAVAVADEGRTNQYAPGVRSTYDCGETDVEGLLTYAVRVYSPNGNLADCAVFSTEPDAQGAVALLFAGDLPEPNEVPSRNQIKPANCTVWTLPSAR